MSTKAAFLTALGGDPEDALGTAGTFTATFADDELTLEDHGKYTGFGPVQVASADTLPDGLLADTDYWMIVVDADTFQLAETKADALAGIAVELADNGTGAHTVFCTKQTLADTMEIYLDEVITEPGLRVRLKDVNIAAFWDAAALGCSF